MEAYRRTLDSAQNALERRDQARDELEDVLGEEEEDAERGPEVELPHEPSGQAMEPETWPKVADLAIQSSSSRERGCPEWDSNSDQARVADSEQVRLALRRQDPGVA
jgi:hypothetical protein